MDNYIIEVFLSAALVVLGFIAGWVRSQAWNAKNLE